jgi:hypothetical protein
MQATPGGWQVQASPQRVVAMETQTGSQKLWQQDGRFWQTTAAHLSQVGESGGPTKQSGWVQVPFSPQMPFVQTREQHAPMQGTPSGRQLSGPQAPPLLHGPLQHGSAGLQNAPSGRQAVSPQTPLVQTKPQQGVTEEQIEPSGRHVGPPQKPPGPQVPEQQSVETLHAAPGGWHTGDWAQTPFSQISVQQSVPVAHAVPTAAHGPPHTPWPHTPSQQVEAVTHAAPCGLHVPPSEPAAPPVDAPMSVLRPQLASRKVAEKRTAARVYSQA